MLQEEVRLFYSPTGVSWHLWPRVALQAAALKSVFPWRGCLPLTDGWGWPLRSCVSGAALQWFMFCFCSPLIRNSGNQSSLSVLDSSHCVGGLLLTEWQDAQIYFLQPSWLVWPFKWKINQLWQFLAVFFHIISMTRFPIRSRCFYRVPVY